MIPFKRDHTAVKFREARNRLIDSGGVGNKEVANHCAVSLLQVTQSWNTGMCISKLLTLHFMICDLLKRNLRTQSG